MYMCLYSIPRRIAVCRSISHRKVDEGGVFSCVSLLYTSKALPSINK